jgi:hypothetical protein
MFIYKVRVLGFMGRAIVRIMFRVRVRKMNRRKYLISSINTINVVKVRLPPYFNDSDSLSKKPRLTFQKTQDS